MAIEEAMFGAGCFWHVEAAFSRVRGVVSTAVGYSGGTKENPTYKDVCSGRTGHAEVVHVEYDPQQVTYGDLLNVFWEMHDPTTPNRQGLDRGSQYRSAIFFYTPEQETAATRSRAELQASDRYRNPIVTEIAPAGPFFRAEEYHQKYYAKTGRMSCG